MTRTIDIDCPNCKNRGVYTIYDSVNITLDPELKEKVLDKSIFRFNCDNCKCSVGFAYQLLYHDEIRQYMIWLLPSEEDTSQPEMPDDEWGLPGYRLRLVKSINRLLEKIRIFDNKLDDKAMEMVKNLIWERTLKKMGLDSRDIFFSKVVIEEGYPLLTFDILINDQYQNSFSIGGVAGGYRKVIDILFTAQTEQQDGWQWIDFNFPTTLTE